jgi:hypothetical protein
MMFLSVSGVSSIAVESGKSTLKATVRQAPYNIAHLFLKLSYLALYLRLLPIQKYRLVVYALMVAVTLFGVTAAVICIFMCSPIEKGWNPTLPGTCLDRKAFLFSSSIINIVFDVIIFLLPVPFLKQLRCTPSSHVVCQIDRLTAAQSTEAAKIYPWRNICLRLPVSNTACSILN